MISLFEIVLLVLFALAGVRLWSGTTSIAARAVSISSLLVLAWRVVGS